MNNPARMLLLVWSLFPLTSAWSQPSTFEWLQAFPAASPPPEFDAAASYDSKRQVMVMFGGTVIPTTTSLSDQTWEWNGGTWNRAMGPGPEGRVASAMVFDSSRGVSVLFGGHNNNQQKINDTWEWNGTAWQFRTTNGPVQRAGHAMVYDSDRKRTVLYGGFIGVGTYLPAETWEWDGNIWQRVGVNGPPLSRYAHAMAYDAKRKVTLLFGGTASLDGLTENTPTDTWAWDGTGWRQAATTGPSARYYPKMVYDSQREMVVLLGGLDTNRNTFTDVWEWNGSQWSPRSAAGLSERYEPAAVFDSSRNQIVLFGGSTVINKGEKIYDETWILGLRETWVDFSYMGTETGEFATPFNTLPEGADFAPSGTIVKIKTGFTTETLHLAKAMTIEAFGGPVVIGR